MWTKGGGKGGGGGGGGGSGVKRDIAKPKGKGKGKGGGGGGKGRGKGTPARGGETGTIGDAKTGKVCWNWAKDGNCKHGTDCHFKHAKEEKAALIGGAGVWLAGDWECPKCKSHNFASKAKCWKQECDGGRPVTTGAKSEQ